LKLILLILAALALPAAAQEIVTLATRPGVTQSFFIANMGERKPQAVALLYVGGGGAINLRLEEGQIKFGQGNFLPRSRREFIRNGVLPVILDAPSDHSREMTDEFRTSEAHSADARAVIAEVKKRHPGLPVFLVGTSRGTLSAAYVGGALGDGVAGVVLTASLFYSGGGTRALSRLAGFDWSVIKSPVLLAHHADDGCGATPYREAARLGRRFALITVHGGKPAESPPCEPLAAHGFFGKEAETVHAIAAWMLGKPFVKEIR
jgi:hypothetical protein